MEVLELMKDIGVKPGSVVFTCLIRQAIQTKSGWMATEIYKRLRREGVKPDRTLFNTIISGLLESDMLAEACEITLDTFKDGTILEGDIYTNVLRKVVATEKEISPGACVLRGMKKHRVPLDEGLEQSLTRIMVDSAIMGEEPQSEERAFGTQLSTNTWADNK